MQKSLSKYTWKSTLGCIYISTVFPMLIWSVGLETQQEVWRNSDMNQESKLWSAYKLKLWNGSYVYVDARDPETAPNAGSNLYCKAFWVKITKTVARI